MNFIFNDNYRIIKQIGEGTSAIVYLCESIKFPTEKYALKIIKDEFFDKYTKSKSIVQKEIEIHEKLIHPNVCMLHDYGEDGIVTLPDGQQIKEIWYMLMEYVEGGNLYQFCKKQKKSKREENSKRLFVQLLDVIEYMHQNGICHRDIKLENILIDENFNIKVTDFGFSADSNIDKLKSYRGTIHYMAPEILHKKQYDGR